MLTSLLPGFRHLRTPFAVGALFTFTFWIWRGASIPTHNEMHGFPGRLYSLAELAGRPITTAVLAFVVYVIGDILKLSTDQLSILNKSPHLSLVNYFDLRRFARSAFEKRAPHGEPSGLVDSLTRKIFEDGFSEIRMRLIVSHLDLYLEHDRTESEGEFRANVAVFSALLWITLAFKWSPLFAVGLLASAMLLVNGLRTLTDANKIIVQALISGVVTSRYYEEEKQRDQASEDEAGRDNT
ncbi:hypothetical protein [Streptomyces sp. TLI_146]|uniref:hypothetical protein n=1 Tax=Streptomyces sp. TLI_146 TaxID=1938858 RepID=UPI000CC60A12|nr:hypothetical protein [Streptomyces sp. TLI_146]PKV85084.1 hypothetical protein BX283_2619 [Streptomyces sp. TLI_146]